MTFWHFLSLTPEAKDGFPSDFGGWVKIQRITLGHLANHDAVGGLTIILTVNDPRIIYASEKNSGLDYDKTTY